MPLYKFLIKFKFWLEKVFQTLISIISLMHIKTFLSVIEIHGFMFEEKIKKNLHSNREDRDSSKQKKKRKRKKKQ
jgi:hypothetical protein